MPKRSERDDGWIKSQTALFSWVTTEAASHPGRRPSPSHVIKPGGRLTPDERVDLYRQMYWARTLDSLADDFPGVRALLGGASFERACRDFLRKEGSRSYTLRDLGKGLPLHLQRTLPSSRADICAVARYEWAQIEAFDRFAYPPASPETLARIPPQRLHLKVQPYVQILTVSYPVGEYVSSLKADGVLRSDASQAFLQRRASSTRKGLKLPAEPRYSLAVHRWEGRLYFKRLARVEAILLRRLQTGPSLTSACANLPFPSSLPAPQAASQLEEWFRVWSGLGWLHLPAR